jgi:hypothetical protein
MRLWRRRGYDSRHTTKFFEKETSVVLSGSRYDADHTGAEMDSLR